MSSLSVQNVSLSFGDLEVLKGVSFDLESGAFGAILGASGCGKTTLLRVICGLQPDHTGSVWIDGREVTALPTHRRRAALVPQEGALFPHLSVADNVAFGMPAGSQVAEYLELVGISELADRFPSQISGGQGQRVALARALATRPDLVLLDEPFSALDAGSRESVRDHVAQALAATGTTALLVTHDLSEALSLADQLIILDDGQVVESGAPKQVYYRPQSCQLANLVGNIIWLSAHGHGHHADTDLGSIPVFEPCLGPGTVALRPEFIELCAAGRPACVTGIRFFGPNSEITMVDAATGHRLTARVHRQELAIGDQVGYRLTGPVAFLPGAPGVPKTPSR